MKFFKFKSKQDAFETTESQEVPQSSEQLTDEKPQPQKGLSFNLSSNLQKIAVSFVFLLAFSGAAMASYLYFQVTQRPMESTSDEVASVREVYPTPSDDPKAPYNVLLLGYGGEGHSGGSLSDVLIVIHVEPQAKKSTAISIPRDLWVDIPVQSDKKEKHKINAAYAIGSDDAKYPLKQPQYKGVTGGGGMAKEVVSQVIGMPVKYFIGIDFGGFEKAIDTLGGIDVSVPKTFDDYYYPIKGAENLSCGKSADEIAELTRKLSGFELEKQFGCRYEHLHFDEGVNHMDGASALKFVRSRHSDQYGGDFARSEKQYEVLIGIRNKLVSLNAVDNWSDFYDKLTGSVKTDMGKGVVKFIIDTQGDLGKYSSKSIHLSTDNVLKDAKSSDGQYILLPKSGSMDTVTKFVQNNLN